MCSIFGMIGSRFQTPFRELALLDGEALGTLINPIYYFNSFCCLCNMPKLFRCPADAPFHPFHAIMDEDAAQVILIDHTQSNASLLILYAT